MRNFLISIAYVVFGAILTQGAAWAQTSYQMITHTHPVAIQRGKAVEVSVEGKQNFWGTYRIHWVRDGIQTDIVEDKKDDKKKVAKDKIPNVPRVKLKLNVAADAPLGVREFRLASPLGVSSVGQVVVVDDPVFVEGKKNNTREEAQEVKLPCVLAGKLERKEDLDYYKFEAQAGQPLSFEVQCARIQDKIHDLQNHAKPMLVLYDDTGRELAANDHFYFADPLLTYTPTKTGTYYLEIRDSTYDGDPRWVYAIISTNQPYISHIYPMAGNPGKTINVEPIGSAKLAAAKVALKVPNLTGIHEIQLDIKGKKTNPATFIVNHLPPALEVEPNDEPKQATRITIPAGINGRMDKNRDLDHFVFKATKGKAITFEVRARRFGTLLNSSVHAVFDIMNDKGRVLTRADQTHGDEAAAVFTPPADGEYTLRVRDLNSKGGASYVYHVEAEFAQQDFTVRCDPDKAMIGPGSSAAWFIHVDRKNGFDGPVTIDVKDLPPTVKATPLTVLPEMKQGLIVFTADEGAGLDSTIVHLTATAKVKRDGKDVTITHDVTPNQEIYNPGGGRRVFDVDSFAVTVTEPSDIRKVKVSTTNIVLKPGEEVKIDVDIIRDESYTKGVSLDIPLKHLNAVYGNPLPPGVTIVSGKSKTLLGKGSKGFITLKAAKNAAPIENVPISVLAHVSINFVVKISYSSPRILVTVVDPKKK